MDLFTKRLLVLAMLGLAAPLSARVAQPADDTVASIARTLESRYPKLKVLDVRPGPLPSLYEVVTGTEVIYTDKDASYVFFGSIYDTHTKKELTAEGVDARNAIDFRSLPFDQPIRVEGDGNRKL